MYNDYATRSTYCNPKRSLRTIYKKKIKIMVMHFQNMVQLVYLFALAIKLEECNLLLQPV